MEVHVFDNTGRELNRKELGQLRIWNSTLDNACKRVRRLERK